MPEPKTLKIDDVEYIRADSVKREPSVKQIVILPRGHVAIGDFSQDGVNCKLTNAAIIRIWGTKNGLGELAQNGKQPNTILDPCPTLRFHEATIIARMDVNEEKWPK